MKKGYIKVFVVSLLVFAVTMFSACSPSDSSSTGPNGESYIGNINGFKTVYRPEDYDIKDYYENFSKEVLKSLSTIFGLSLFPENENNDNKVDFINEKYEEIYGEMEETNPNFLTYTDFEQNYRIYFVDDIRNSIYLYDSEENTYDSRTEITYNWNWSIATDNDYEYLYNEYYALTYFNGYQSHEYSPADTFYHLDNSSGNVAKERNNFYSVYYNDKYAECLQVAILQILLGKTPTTFSYNFSTNEVSPSAQNLLNGTNGLKNEYKKVTTYVGISENDKVKITNYILDSVIGQQKFSQTSSNNHFSRDDYKSVIENVIWQNTLASYSFSNEETGSVNDFSLGSIYDTYPTVMLKDYASNQFYISSVDGHNFDHITKAEYQSVILMPSETNYLSEVWFYIVSDRILNVKIQYRYYDAQSSTYFVSDFSNMTTSLESNFRQETAKLIRLNFEKNGRETLYKTMPFNNSIGNNAIKASSEKPLDSNASQYFNSIESSNGFGYVNVLNQTKFSQDNSSYLELVFDVQKDSNNLQADYSFKVGMYSLWFASQEMIDNYLLNG